MAAGRGDSSIPSATADSARNDSECAAGGECSDRVDCRAGRFLDSVSPGRLRSE